VVRLAAVDVGGGGEVAVLESAHAPSTLGPFDGVVFVVSPENGLLCASGPGTLRPLTPQASTGNTTVFRT